MKLTSSKKKKSTPKKAIIIAISIAVIVIALGAVYLINTQLNNKVAGPELNPIDKVNYDTPTETEKEESDTKKDEIIKDYEKEQSDTDGGQSNDIAVTISRLNQTGAGVSIGSVVSGTSSGTCEVKATKNGQPTVTKNFPVVFEATSAFCQEALLSLGDFSVGGEWEVSIIIKSDGKTSAPATQKVTVNK